MAALFMESTSISPERTAAMISLELVKAKANKIMNEYADGKLTAMKFAIDTPVGDLPFRLPVRIDPVFQILQSRRKFRSDRDKFAAADRAKAERVAWRQAYRWIQAQVAMIQTGMVSTQEVFMPYLTVNGETLYEKLNAGGFQKLLAAGGESRQGG